MNQITIDGKQLFVFDNAVRFSARERAYSYIRNSLYRIGNEDADAIESAHHKYLCSYYTQKDVEQTGILEEVKGTQIEQMIAGMTIVRAHVNLSTPADGHWAHAHENQIGMLYYVNKHWKHDWAGETLFFNDDLTEIPYASVYTPGRIIIFDGEIPHSVRPQAAHAPHYRFTLSIFFQR